MPTTTTTVTTADADGTTTTVTTTVAAPEPSAPEPSAPEPSATPADAGDYVGTVAVTGAAGYIATEVVKQLLEKGYSVRATVRAQEPSEHLQKLADVLPGKIELFEADLNDAGAGAFDECFIGCSEVHHIAANVGGWEKDPYVEVVNPVVEGVKGVLSSAKNAGVKRVVMTSSTFAVFDPISQPSKPPVKGPLYSEADFNTNTGDEFIRSTDNPWGAYGCSKTISEDTAWATAKELGIDLVVINPGLVYGPPCCTAGSATIAIITASLFEANPLIVGGLFSPIDVRDVAKAHVAAAETPSAAGRYHVAHETTLDQAVLTAPVTAALPQLQVTPFTQPDGVGSVKRFDNSKAVGLIGELIPIDTMVVDTVRVLLARGLLEGLGWKRE